MSAGSDKDKGSGALTPRDAAVADAQHTAGPWEIAGDKIISSWKGPSEARYLICNLPDDDRANARLIVRAPEMKAALERIWIESMAGDDLAGKLDAIFGISRQILADLAGVEGSNLPVPQKPQPPAKAGEAKQ